MMKLTCVVLCFLVDAIVTVHSDSADQITTTEVAVKKVDSFIEELNKWAIGSSQIVWLAANVLLTPIATIFYAVGVVFSFFYTLLFGPDQKGIEMVQQNFALVQTRFDILETKLNELMTQVQLAPVANDYKNERIKLKTLYATMDRMIKHPGNHSLQHFQSQCISKDPYHVLNWIHEHATKEFPPPSLVVNIYKAANFDLKGMRMWLAIILSDTYYAAMIYLVCLSTSGGFKANDSYTEAIINETAQKYDEVRQKLNETHESMFDDFATGAESDAIDILQKAHGSQSHDTVANQILEILTKKYYWLHFVVVISDPTTDSNRRASHGRLIQIDDKYGRNTFIGWCRKENKLRNFHHALNVVRDFYTDELTCANLDGNAEAALNHFKARDGGVIRNASSIYYLHPKGTSYAAQYVKGKCIAVYNNVCGNMKGVVAFDQD